MKVCESEKKELLTIDPDYFAEAMERHWIETCCNVSSPALKQTWREICVTFNMSMNGSYKKWDVIPAPTGAGKTQALILYNALLLNLAGDSHKGTLIVTRRKDDADSIANQINALAEVEDGAVAYHSDSLEDIQKLSSYKCLVITHKRYENALESLGKDHALEDSWRYFCKLENGEDRALVVVDEALDIVRHYELTHKGLAGLHIYLTDLYDKFPKEITLIKAYEELFKQIKAEETNKRSTGERIIRSIEDLSSITDYNLSLLRKEIVKVVLRLTNRFRNKAITEDFKNEVDRVLIALEQVHSLNIYMTKKKGEHHFNASKLILPFSFKGGVILDATAKENLIYALIGDDVHIKILPNPYEVRNYSPVTMYTLKGQKVGKEAQSDLTETDIKRYVAEIMSKTEKDSKILLITHKVAEDDYKSYIDSRDLKGRTISVDHWKNLDGSNQYKDYDTVVITSLPYPPKANPINTFKAFHEIDQSFLDNPSERRCYGKEDIKKALEYSPIKVDVIQALNRVRCRKTIDTEGRCLKTDIFIMLPSSDLAEELIKSIEGAMPQITVKEWEWSPDTMYLRPNQRKTKASKKADDLIRYFKKLPATARVSLQDICNDTGIGRTTLHGLVEDTLFHKRMIEEGQATLIREGKRQLRYVVKST